MLFGAKTIEIPTRYAMHLPAGIPANSLVDAASAVATDGRTADRRRA